MHAHECILSACYQIFKKYAYINHVHGALALSQLRSLKKYIHIILSRHRQYNYNHSSEFSTEGFKVGLTY
jgi:hypothetical protein